MNIEIKPLTPELIGDFLHYFDEVGFSNNLDWSGCYCYFHHFPGSIEEWLNRTKEENRADSKKSVLSGVTNGFLAYEDGNPIGWINTDLKENYVKVPYEEEINPSKEGKVASIVCILIAPLHRRKGIAKQLLKNVMVKLKENGIKIVEAYPRIGDLSDAHQYHGPLSLYQSEGFLIVKKLKGMVVVQKEL